MIRMAWLRRQHDRMDRTISMLGGAAMLLPESAYILREGCCTLSHQLHAHCEDEAATFAQYTANADTAPLLTTAIRHEAQLQALRRITRVFGDDAWPLFLQSLSRALGAVTERLREEFRVQEADLLLDDAERTVAMDHVLFGSAAPAISEETLLSEILSGHPETQPVFHRLMINLTYERYDHLADVARRHHMSSSALRAQLEQAIDDAYPVYGAFGADHRRSGWKGYGARR